MKITEDEIKRICSPTIYKRGVSYFKDGRVHLKLRDENEICALVDGEEIYNVRVVMDDDKVCESFCTCPYYQTMEANCKHIVAVLKKRQCELEDNENFKDKNDRIAQLLCAEFAQNCFEKKRLNLKFTLNIITSSENKCRFYLSAKCGFDSVRSIEGVDSFFESYMNQTDFKISKHCSINSSKYSLGEYDKQIIEILCEACQNKSYSQNYTKRISETEVAPATVKRLLPYLIKTDYELCLNSLSLHDLRVVRDNPDILIDINATDNEITLNIFESGISLFRDGSWFLYENCLYNTEHEWREWFMPIYNSLMNEARTQIDFKGSTRIDFATYVYPKLRDRQGVVTTGLDSILINEKPVFSVYLSYANNYLNAVVKVSYGHMSIELLKNPPDSEHIVIRNLQAENKIASFFDEFNREDEMFTLSDNSLIYDFIYNKINLLKNYAKIYTDDSFNSLYDQRNILIHSDVKYNNAIDLLEVDFETELSSDELIDILNSVRLNEKYYKFKDGGFILIDKDTADKFKLFDILGFSEKEIRNHHKVISKYHVLYLEALKNDGRINTDSGFDKLIDSIKQIKANIPSNLDNVLRQYQKEGVLWLKQLSELGFGGILADDMGLGKTLEVIAFIAGEKKDKPALVVTPSALTYNWLNEIKKFTPSLKAKIIDGTKEERQVALEKTEDYDFIITSYPLLRRDQELFSKLEFSFMFIDESQHIKNPDTMSAKAVKKIKAERKFALSGTPIENRLTELWSVFDFVMKGYLGTRKEFSQNYYKVLSDDTEHTENLDELRKKISPFILRRMKSDVLSELPEKIENTIYSELLPEQKSMYDAFRAAAKKEINSLIDDGGNGIQILTLLLRLRQICCHPALFDTNYKKDSGKLILLEDIIESATSQGHRVLVFSQFTSMLEIMRKRLREINKDCFFIDGKTPSSMRNELAERFNNGEKEVFLVSLKAGGTGLNLTGADMVILYDPWWNPAVMEQASDRAYRIGQTKAVQVIKLAAKGTIEEQILKLQENKKNLANSVIKKNEKTISGLTREEILSLFD